MDSETAYRKLIEKFDRFMGLADEMVQTHPAPVILAIHEFHRNLYRKDPYIPFPEMTPKKESLLARMDQVIQRCHTALEAQHRLGSYFRSDRAAYERQEKLSQPRGDTGEGAVQKVYDQLWEGLDRDKFLLEAKTIIEERFSKHRPLLKELKEKRVLDMGCGSGRYTVGLSQFGPEKVVGVDLGENAISRVKKLADDLGVRNIEFQVASVLDLPFEDNSFDFVFCNGVLHHTVNMEKGIQEYYRVLKTGSPGWLYLYADGGLYWYARKRMPQVMKKIPMSYTMKVLELVGMPGNRFFFCDNWYVPYERHTTRRDLERMLKDFGFSRWEAVASQRDTDIDEFVLGNAPEAKELFGDGELRYVVWK